MTSRTATLSILALPLLAAACAEWSTGPDIVGATPTTISIRYDSTKVDMVKVEDTAKSYCESLHRHPHLRTRFASRPEMSYADYSCVGSEQ